MIKDLQLNKTDTILDIAGGTGDPGLKIAAIVTEGKVICTDQAEGMLAIAKKKAAEQKLKNFTTQLAEVSNLPFDDAIFNAVSCRYGFMFFPDMMQAAQEMVRVLKPGGHLATAVWDGPHKNYWITVIMDTIKKYNHRRLALSIALSKADNDTQNKIKEEVVNKVNEKFGKGKVNIPASTIVISGEK